MQWEDAGGSSRPTAAAAEPATVELAVADGAVEASPVAPLEISVTGGELDEVSVTDGDTAPVPGAVSDSAEDEAADDDAGRNDATGEPAGGDAQVWTPESPLTYGTSYTLRATATSADEAETTSTSTFTTVALETLSTPSIGPLDGQTVGVGMPIRVWFDDSVVDRTAVESHLEVTSTTATDSV
ncbi:Ig-like domain-containing protein [Blastococcus capsensis]|uniref:Ig-like domain-containing protein n=1 Tax=Blastococcus capsensis TaxID=1564163 RepID=UPI002540E415|nr:Ig-like domain-containing protein [Blastococcus capsensis]MDK3258889.1 Ig-like domain-containing protein [Blastococcus capsensis]